MYLAEGEPKGSQIFVRYVDTDGPATQVTHVAEAPRNARWSPDGKSIAFSMFVPDQEKWTISMPAEPKGAKWTPAPRVVSTIHYRQDGVGYLDGVVTLPPFRRRSVASATVTAAVGASVANGDALVHLLAEEAGDPQRLYERLGFAVAGRVESFTRPLPGG